MKHTAICLMMVMFVCSPALAEEPSNKTGLEKVEAAPTAEACCQNAYDRATAAAHKVCNPAKAENIVYGDCEKSQNEQVPEYTDCTRSWSATCTTGGTESPPPAQQTKTTPEEESACRGVSCSEHGLCIAVGDIAVCQCEAGYGPDPATGQGCLSLDDFHEKLEAFIEEE